MVEVAAKDGESGWPTNGFVQPGWWGSRQWGRDAGITSGSCTFVCFGSKSGVGSIVWLGDSRWQSGGVPGAFIWPGRGGSKVVVGEQDAGVTSGGRAFIGFGSESRRAQSGGFRRAGTSFVVVLNEVQ